MKKIQLSIPKPCHENWDAMTTEDKGRFCTSCQKTVMDFSNMSDRQVAEFFKKPKESVCGRFHQDQLERTLEVSRKRIPWVKYFFQVSWPAFVLMLKSCGQRDDVQGKIAVQKSAEKNEKDFLVGALGKVMTNITPIDSVPAKRKPRLPVPPSVAHQTMGEVAVSDSVMGDTMASPSKCVIDTTKLRESMLDTLTVTAYNNTCQRMYMGAVSMVTVKKIQKVDPLPLPTPQPFDVKAFPNPVKAGSSLTVSLLSGKEELRELHIVSGTGALVFSKQLELVNEGNASFSIPSSLLSGTYFVQIITKNNLQKVTKIVVVN